MSKARYVEWVKDNCNYCEACRIVCTENAITINDRILIIHKIKCSACLDCIEECPSEALILSNSELKNKDLPLNKGA